MLRSTRRRLTMTAAGANVADMTDSPALQTLTPGVDVGTFTLTSASGTTFTVELDDGAGLWAVQRHPAPGAALLWLDERRQFRGLPVFRLGESVRLELRGSWDEPDYWMASTPLVSIERAS